VVGAISEATGLGKSEVWVVFEEIAARDWYVGPSSVEKMRQAAAE